MRLVTLRGDARAALTLAPADGLRRAMQVMNASGRTFVLVTDGDRLVGVISDGDIRRHLAEGGSVDAAVTDAVNRMPTTLPATAAHDDIRGFMVRRGLDYLPLVDGDKVVALCVLDHLPPSNQLTAVILAGGEGSRLAPLTENCPKPLLPLGDRPILSHIIDHLQGSGINRFFVSVNYLAHMIVEYYSDGSPRNAFIEYVRESKKLGTGGPLGLLDEAALSDPFLVLNGDVINDVDVQALYDAHVEGGWDATMVVHEHDLQVPYGVVESGDATGEFLRIDEKPVLAFRVNAGIYMVSKAALKVIPHNEFYDMPTLFDDLRRLGLRGGVFRHTGRWLDLGTRSDYDRAQQMYRAGGGR